MPSRIRTYVPQRQRLTAIAAKRSPISGLEAPYGKAPLIICLMFRDCGYAAETINPVHHRSFKKPAVLNALLKITMWRERV